MNRLLLLGLNHTTAPIEVRERIALASSAVRDVVGRFRAQFPGCEVAVLSTCNRVEVYAAPPPHGAPRAGDMVAFLADVTGTPADAFRSYLYERADRDAVAHLFGVAASLDSMVLGETQILGQVREAYEASAALGAAGPQLNPLFQRALAVGKQVMAQTPLAEGRTSVASVAVDYARRVFDHFGDKTVLCVGAGEMAALVLQAFAALRPRRVLVCNRDLGRAEKLAAQFDGVALPFAALADGLVAADVVVTSTASPRPVVTRAMFDGLVRRRRYRPLFVVDIALPRDVEPSVGDVANTYLYNLDDLQKVVAATRSTRTGAVDAARAIVARHVDDYLAGTRARALGPTIDKLYRRYHDLAGEELARTLGKLPNVSAAERGHLEDLTRRIVNKLLHDPVQTLRKTGDLHAPAGQYLHALEQLFRLEGPAGEPTDTTNASETSGASDGTGVSEATDATPAPDADNA